MSKRDETILLVILTVGAVALLLLPFSAASFEDLVKAWTGR
jgi:hypothetical protein